MHNAATAQLFIITPSTVICDLLNGILVDISTTQHSVSLYGSSLQWCSRNILWCMCCARCCTCAHFCYR